MKTSFCVIILDKQKAPVSLFQYEVTGQKRKYRPYDSLTTALNSHLHLVQEAECTDRQMGINRGVESQITMSCCELCLFKRLYENDQGEEGKQKGGGGIIIINF